MNVRVFVGDVIYLQRCNLQIRVPLDWLAIGWSNHSESQAIQVKSIARESGQRSSSTDTTARSLSKDEQHGRSLVAYDVSLSLSLSPLLYVKAAVVL